MIGTKSSTSTIATIVAIVAAWYGMRNTSKNLARINAWGVMLAYCSVQILIFMGSLPFISSIVVKLFGKDLTFSGRTKIWIQMPVLIAQKPIWGWGQLSGSTVGSILGNKFFTSAHNQWLNTLFQGGVILFLLVALIIIWLSNSTRKFEKNIGNMKLLMLLSIMIDMISAAIMVGGFIGIARVIRPSGWIGLIVSAIIMCISGLIIHVLIMCNMDEKLFLIKKITKRK